MLAYSQVCWRMTLPLCALTFGAIPSRSAGMPPFKHPGAGRAGGGRCAGGQRGGDGAPGREGGQRPGLRQMRQAGPAAYQLRLCRAGRPCDQDGRRGPLAVCSLPPLPHAAEPPMPRPLPAAVPHRVSMKGDHPGVLRYLLLCIATPLYVDRSLVGMHGALLSARSLALLPCTSLPC